jgi:endoglucanase
MLRAFAKNCCSIIAASAILLSLPIVTAYSQDDDLLAPPEIPGEAIYIPFPVEIALDGNVSDWEGVPSVTVDKGPMTSPDPAENGSFAFAVAADAEYLYISMSMLDKTIIAGQHGSEFWNEDSIEFFVNASGDLYATSYSEKIFQININAADIGNTDPDALTITGVNSLNRGVRGFVFATENGWGCEVALPLEGLVKPAHGLEIGFQAQANGASELDRNVKLIWSNADTGDTSWQDPGVFGRALFFEVGQTEVPQPSPRIEPTPAPTPTPIAIPRQVSVNQTGYLPGASKRAAFASDLDRPLDWTLKDAAGATVLNGQTIVWGFDESSGDHVHHIDFSSYTTPGTGYVLEAGGIESAPFGIALSIYGDLKYDALAYFYHNRSGIPIEAEYAGEDWARPAGHLSDERVTCYQGKDDSGKFWDGCDYRLDVSGGWYDAGDFGKYVVNGGISVWTLMNVYERNPDAFGDGTLSIPENDNGVPDILDEARLEMEFLLAMQVPTGQPQAGMAHHKIHDAKWAGMPLAPPTEVNNDDPINGRFLFPPSTAATLNLAATAAQCARIWEFIDPTFSAQCLAAAESAWEAAQANPRVKAVSFPDVGGGLYGDDNVEDEFYWAAAELYITTGEDGYKDFLLSSRYFSKSNDVYWGGTAPLGTISLAVVPNDLTEEQVQACRDDIVSNADRFIGMMDREGYLVPLDGYYWGSNSGVLNNMLFMGLAYDFTGDPTYVDAVRESMDYLLGRNPLNKSYISGYGEDPLEHPHHRFWGNDLERGFPPPPPGVIAGGPNSNPDDPTAKQAGLPGMPPAKCYIDDLGSWTTNEVTINWNAPLAWSAAFLDETRDVSQSATTPAEVAGTQLPYWVWVALTASLIIVAIPLAIWLLRRRRA